MLAPFFCGWSQSSLPLLEWGLVPKVKSGGEARAARQLWLARLQLPRLLTRAARAGWPGSSMDSGGFCWLPSPRLSRQVAFPVQPGRQPGL